MGFYEVFVMLALCSCFLPGGGFGKRITLFRDLFQRDPSLL